MHTVPRNENKNYSYRKAVGSLLAERGRDSMGVRFAELLILCGSAREVHRAIAGLRAGGWRIGEKIHSDKRLFFWAIADPSAAKFPTAHFRDDTTAFARPHLAAPPVALESEP
jgi:hypothetical protein